MQNQQLIQDNISKFIWHYLKPHKLAQLGFVIVAVCWAIELTLSPYLLKRIIDVAVKFSGETMVAHILLPCIFYALMTVWMNINFRFYNFIGLKIYPTIKAQISQDMFDYLIPHSYDFFQNNFAGTLTKKIFDMATNVERILQIINEWFYPRIFALLIAAMSMALVVKPVFGLVLLLWTISYALLSFVSSKWMVKYAHHRSLANAKMSGTISDSVSNIMLTKLFSNMSYESKHVGHALNNFVWWDRKVNRIQLYINALQGVMITILTILMLVLLVHYHKANIINAGDFAFVLTLSMFIGSSVWQIGTQMLEFSKSVGECRQAMSYLTEPHAIADLPQAQPLTISQGDIEFKDVNFAYNTHQTLFENLNINIKGGEKIGLVGSSGGGKSTFIKLILRLMDTQKGSIYIDNQDIKQIQKDSLRSQISTIPQEIELFHRSILENIRFARPEATDDEVIHAAKKAHCHDFITALPDGYDALVGERGVKLSGGQKQRIAIARAFLKNARILLLDEATSALDSATEKLIQAGLQDLMRNKTTIAIAHRLSTLKNMDRILVFDNGKIIQDGTLKQLTADKSGIFYTLWQMQSKVLLFEEAPRM